jgi:Ca2+-binding RTX toxin-like protein
VEEVQLLGCDGLDATGNALANVLVGNTGDNTLSGLAGNDTLAGGQGDDLLTGGAGSDTYVYSLHHGNDVINENGTSGQIDTLKLQDVSPGTVRVNKTGNDLIVDFPGRDGRVTLKNWFSSSASRIERFQFDNGTVWDETRIRSQVGKRVDPVGDYPSAPHRAYDDHDGHRNGEHWGDHDHDHDHDRDRDGHDDDGRRRDGVDEAIARRLAQPARFSFDEVTRALGDPNGPTMTAQQVAQRWAAVQGYTQCLDGCGDGSSQQHDADIAAIRRLFGVPDPSGCGFGFAGSTGNRPAAEGFQVFQGLVDGMKKL